MSRSGSVKILLRQMTLCKQSIHDDFARIFRNNIMFTKKIFKDDFPKNTLYDHLIFVYEFFNNLIVEFRVNSCSVQRDSLNMIYRSKALKIE